MELEISKIELSPEYSSLIYFLVCVDKFGYDYFLKFFWKKSNESVFSTSVRYQDPQYEEDFVFLATVLATAT